MDPASLPVHVPDGELVRSRVVPAAAAPLEDALDRRLTGYAVLEPREAVLLDGDGAAVITFDDGVPVLAYHPDADRGGPAALAALATPGPYLAELYALAPADLAPAHERAGDDLRVPPGMPAERLAADGDLAERTRRAAPEREGVGESAVEAFLADEERVAAIREQARAEAERRAAEWGFENALEE
jgi:hypothetical protein